MITKTGSYFKKTGYLSIKEDMAKRKNTEESNNSNGWMVTFTNLMILLLAFFIVLVNMSVPDNQKKRVALNSLLGSFGLLPGGQSPIGKDSGSDITMPDAPLTKLTLDLEQLQNIASTNGLDTDVNVSMEADKIVLSINNRILFEKNEHNITDRSADYLLGISKILREGPGLIELRGYVDKRETLLEEDQITTAIYLSTKRALAVLHFLNKKGKIPISRLIAHGFGTAPQTVHLRGQQPREWQGQVDIILNYRQNIPYKFRVKKQRKWVLDFKGFLFESRGLKDDEKE